MIYGQLARAAMWFAKFHAGTKKSLLDFWRPQLKQPMKFVIVFIHWGLALGKTE